MEVNVIRKKINDSLTVCKLERSDMNFCLCLKISHYNPVCGTMEICLWCLSMIIRIQPPHLQTVQQLFITSRYRDPHVRKFRCLVTGWRKLDTTPVKPVNPSSPGDTIWRTQLLAPYSGYPHMVSLRSCSESRIPPYGAPYFTAKNNHLQFDWLIFYNSKQFFDCLSVF